jgi:hypothetical protein
MVKYCRREFAGSNAMQLCETLELNTALGGGGGLEGEGDEGEKINKVITGGRRRRPN